MTEISDLIIEEAGKAASKSVDGTTVTRRSLSELIAADNHARSIEGTKPANILATLRGMSVKMVPPGAP